MAYARLCKPHALSDPFKVAPGAWRINGASGVLAEFIAAGKVSVQDEASQLVGLQLEVQPGQRVLDLCAAPGSKTTHIADLSHDSAVIVAADLHEHRLRTLVSSAQIQGLGSIHCVALDGLRPLPLPEGAFDRVLVTPGSGWHLRPGKYVGISPADI